MVRDLCRCVGQQVALWHRLEVGIYFFNEIRRKNFRDRLDDGIPFDATVFVKGFVVGEVKARASVKLPDEGFFPVGPRFFADALTVDECQEHEVIEVGLASYEFRELGDGGRVLEISALGGVREGDVVVDEEDEAFALGRG